MSRYIELNKVLNKLGLDHKDYVYIDKHEVAERIKKIPSIDIVRCKECRHSFINENHPQKPRICGLTKMCGTTKDDWFCADGERREP